jgi:hypothetical protein
VPEDLEGDELRIFANFRTHNGFADFSFVISPFAIRIPQVRGSHIRTALKARIRSSVP